MVMHRCDTCSSGPVWVLPASWPLAMQLHVGGIEESLVLEVLGAPVSTPWYEDPSTAHLSRVGLLLCGFPAPSFPTCLPRP